MKIMMRLTAAALALGMLGAAACSSCSQPTDDSASSAVTQPTSYRCGAGTVQQGNQCVATTSSSSSSGSTTRRVQTINSSGNN